MTFDEFYKLYASSIKNRRSFESGIVPVINDRFKAVEDALSQRSMENVYRTAIHLNEYNKYWPKPTVEIQQGELQDLFTGLEKKYEFSLVSIGTGFESIKFKSRAVISEVDAKKNLNLTVDLGFFETYIRFGDRIDKTSVKSNRTVAANPAGSNNPKSIDGYTCYHPHINSAKELCLGSYGGQLTKDAQAFDVMSIFYNLCGLLNRYNGNSLMFAGAYISNWVGATCPVCLQLVQDPILCAKTKLKIHKDCAEEIDGKFYSLDHVKTCTKCSKPAFNFIAYSKTEVVCSNCEEK